MTPVQMADKTNFAQSLMHMIKGNLGTGILAMPASFAQCGLVTGSLGLPVLCLLATYCVHLLVRSSQQLESKLKWLNPDYAELAKGAFRTGPAWMRPFSGFMCRLTDLVLIVSQVGICCVYLVFIVNNVSMILASYSQVTVPQLHLFGILLLPTLSLSFVRTLRRLSIASGLANGLQVAGICVVLEYLLRNTNQERRHELSTSFAQVALGFGSAMFAFEGISVVMPIYARMKRPEQMGGLLGVINLSYALLLALYALVGLFGYLRFGAQVHGSITLDLPQEPLYDLVRAAFTLAIFLTYPLQFYVPAEILCNWLRGRLASRPADDKQAPAHAAPALAWCDYACRTGLVLLTFLLAIMVPKLHLLMDLVGSVSGTALSITLPALIHLATFWEDTRGLSRGLLVLTDVGLVLVGVAASASGSYFSLQAIVSSFHESE